MPDTIRDETLAEVETQVALLLRRADGARRRSPDLDTSRLRANVRAHSLDLPARRFAPSIFRQLRKATEAIVTRCHKCETRRVIDSASGRAPSGPGRSVYECPSNSGRATDFTRTRSVVRVHPRLPAFAHARRAEA